VGIASLRRHAFPPAALLALLMLLLYCSAPISPAQAAGVEKVKSYGVYGEQVEDSDDGCRHSSVSLVAVYDSSFDWVSLSYREQVYNSCTGTQERDLYGYLDMDPDDSPPGVATVSISGPLSSARLTATIEVNDLLTGSYETLEIDETFTGSGPLTRSTDRTKFVIPGEQHGFATDATWTRPALGSGSFTFDNAAIYQSASRRLFHG